MYSMYAHTYIHVCVLTTIDIQYVCFKQYKWHLTFGLMAFISSSEVLT